MYYSAPIQHFCTFMRHHHGEKNGQAATLDQVFAASALESLRERPHKGWIRTIRDALGMTSRQLATRMGRAHSTLVRLESNEVTDAISLGTLRAAAAALDCTLVYALVPNRPLKDMVHDRAATIAEESVSRSHHSMLLENQGVSEAELTAERERLTALLLKRRGSHLWRDV